MGFCRTYAESNPHHVLCTADGLQGRVIGYNDPKDEFLLRAPAWDSRASEGGDTEPDDVQLSVPDHYYRVCTNQLANLVYNGMCIDNYTVRHTDELYANPFEFEKRIDVEVSLFGVKSRKGPDWAFVRYTDRKKTLPLELQIDWAKSLIDRFNPDRVFTSYNDLDIAFIVQFDELFTSNVATVVKNAPYLPHKCTRCGCKSYNTALSVECSNVTCACYVEPRSI